MTIETHIDDDPLVEGTHNGISGSTTLYDSDMIFPIVGVSIGVAIYKEANATSYAPLIDQDGNIIRDQNGNAILSNTLDTDQNDNVTAFTEHTVTSGITHWNYGDTYKIYKTATKNSFISRIGIDRSRGWKYTDKKKLTSFNWRPEDVDIDTDTDGYILPKDKRPFSKGRPKRSRRIR